LRRDRVSIEQSHSEQMTEELALLVLLSVAVFLFVNQIELYDSSISFVYALMAGIAPCFGCSGCFRKTRLEARPGGSKSR